MHGSCRLMCFIPAVVDAQKSSMIANSSSKGRLAEVNEKHLVSGAYEASLGHGYLAGVQNVRGNGMSVYPFLRCVTKKSRGGSPLLWSLPPKK